jgi:hypothetical protein
MVGKDEKVAPRTDEGQDSRGLAEVLKALGLDNSNNMLKREFRITGIVGTTAECITYISLGSQIAEGRKRGYSDEDISLAIKKAVKGGSELRTILDAKIDMDLMVIHKKFYEREDIHRFVQRPE